MSTRVVQMTACECRKTEHYLALIEEAIEAVREAVRLFLEDERLRVEELQRSTCSPGRQRRRSGA